MNMLWNTDDEMNRYDEADLLAGITSPEMISDAKSVFNTNTGQTDLLAPLPSGGFVKLASQAPNVMVESPTMPGMVEPLPVEGPLARAAERTAAESQSKRRPMQLSPNTNTGQTGFFDNATSEIGKGLIRGAIVEPANFLKDNFGLYDPLVVQLVDPVTGEFDFDIKILSREEKADLDARMAAGEMPYAISLDELVASDETAGTGSQAIGGMAQFVGAFAGVGKLFKVGQGFKAGMTQGAAADFLGFDGSDAGITDLLLGFGVPDAMLPDFLEKDPNDPDYIGRLQAAFEGAFIGGAIEKLIPLVGKVFRSIKDGDVPAEVVTQSISDGKEAMRQALVSAGENAQTRITERGTGTTMMSGVDPTVITDPLLAAAGRAVEDGKMSSKAQDAASKLSKEFGVDFNVSNHPTSYGNSTYVSGRIAGPDGTFVDVGFRLSDHSTGDKRKATDDFLTIIDDGEVTAETLVAEVQGQLDRALPKMQKMSDDREAKAIAQSDALSRWSNLSGDERGEIAVKFNETRPKRFNNVPWKNLTKQQKADFAAREGLDKD